MNFTFRFSLCEVSIKATLVSKRFASINNCWFIETNQAYDSIFVRILIIITSILEPHCYKLKQCVYVHILAI